MFYNCRSLLSLDLSNFDTSSVIHMGCMFHDCNSLISLDLSNIDTSSVTNMIFMFYNCSTLKSIGLSNLDTSSVQDMNFMFYNCYSLISLDLSNFDTSSVTDMNKMFYNCSSLKSLDLSNFNTSSVINMGCMFQYCSSLLSLDISNFDTSSVTNMEFMFYNCYSLISLNLDKFNASSVKDLSYMFSNCHSIVSLNLTNFNINADKFDYMFNDCNKNLIYCIDEKTTTYIFEDLLSEYEKNCAGICIIWNSKKYIVEENLCVDNCSSYAPYKYENNNICSIEPFLDNKDYISTTDYITDMEIPTAFIQETDTDILGSIIAIPISEPEIPTTFIQETDTDILGSIIKIPISDPEIPTTFIQETDTDIQGPIVTLPSSDTVVTNPTIIISSSDKKTSTGIIIGIISGVVVIIILIIILIIFKKKKFCFKKEKKSPQENKDTTIGDLPLNNSDIHILRNVEIFPQEYDCIKIILYENEKLQTEINNIPFKAKASELIDMFYKKKGIRKDNQIQKLFICNNENIASKLNENKKIKDFIKKNSDNHILIISVLEQGNTEIKKINIIEGGYLLFELYLPCDKKVRDLIDVYYEKKGIKNENKKLFYVQEIP